MNVTTIKHMLSPYVQEVRIFEKNMKLLLTGRKKLCSNYPVITISNKNADTFFGYYDISPFRNEEILYVVKPKKSNFLDIVVGNTDGKCQTIVARTKAWNWQQGCRLRWFPSEKRVISFNGWNENGKYNNTLLDLDSKEKRIIDYPLYDIDSKGVLGLSVDFERLGRLRPGYGYTRNGKDLAPMIDNGIDVIDIQNNKIIKTIDYNRIISCFKRKINIDNCYLNHLSFSPDGSKFLFFLIEIIEGYHMAYLLVYDLHKDEVIVLDEEEKVSHYVWLDNNSIICTAYKDPRTCRYYLYEIETPKKTLLAPSSLDRDGHPSISNQKDIVLTDTYPDEYFFQHLMFVDLNKDTKYPVADVYSDPHIKGEMRTDLHPRFNDTFDLISFDANIRGNRNLYIIQLNK